MKLRLYLTLAALALIATRANAFIQSEGHADVAVWYSPSDGYQLKLSNSTAWSVEPEQATIFVNNQSREPLPNTIGFGGTGLTTGQSFWKLPASASEAAAEQSTWLGIAVHGVPQGGNGTIGSTSPTEPTGQPQLRLELAGVTGPGAFFMWQDLAPNTLGQGGPGGPGFESRRDLLQQPGMAFTTIGGLNSIDLWNPMHTHVNWGFSTAGDYQVRFRLTGRDAAGNSIFDEATYNFLVQSVPTSTATGDLNNDGLVDRADLNVLMTSFGTRAGATLEMGDLNHDGKVGLADVSLLTANYGTSVGVGSPAAVPEPATWSLLAIGITAFWLRTRTKRCA